MKVTFKEFLAESMLEKAKQVAADFLDTSPNELQPVEKSVENEVLEKGKELKRQHMRVASGAVIVRLFKALNSLFARIETPDQQHAMFTTQK